jgi:hypothetical protein
MSLKECLDLVRMDRATKRKIERLVKKYRREGMDADAAGRRAAMEHLEAIETELDDVRDQLGVEDAKEVARIGTQMIREEPEMVAGPERDLGEKPDWHRSQDEAREIAKQSDTIDAGSGFQGSVKDAIRVFQEQIKEKQGKSFVNKDSGISVMVSNSGINHAEGTMRFPAEVKALTVLDVIIQNATASKPEASTKPRAKSVLKLYAPVKIGEKTSLIKITAMEGSTDSIHRFYDLSSVEIVPENKTPQPGGTGLDADAVPNPLVAGDDGTIARNQPEGNGQDSGPLYGPKRLIFPAGNKSAEVLADWAVDSLPTLRMKLSHDIDRIEDGINDRGVGFFDNETAKSQKEEKRATLEKINSIDPLVMAEHIRAFPQHYLANAERKTHPAFVFLERHEAPPAESRIPVDTIAAQNGEWKAEDTKKSIEALEADLRKVMKKPPTLSVSKGLPEEAGGMYDPKNRAVQTRFHNMLDTVAHEMAHAIEAEIGMVAEAEKDADIRSDLIRASQHGTREQDTTRRLHEGMAEVVRAWMVNPSMARARHSAAVAFIESKIKPEILTPLRAYGDRVRKFFGQSALGRIAAVQSSTVDAAEEERRERGIFQILKDLAYATIGRRSRKDYKRKKLGQVPSGWRRDRGRKLGTWESMKEALGYHFHDADLPMINNWNLSVMMGGMDPGKLRPSELLPRWLDFVRGSGGRVRDMILRFGLSDRNMNTAKFANGDPMILGNLVKSLADIAEHDGDLGRLLDLGHAVGSAQRTVELAARKRAELADELEEKINDKYPAIRELPEFRRIQATKDLESEISDLKNQTKEEIERLTAAGGELESSEEVAKEALEEFAKMPEKERKAIEQYLDNYRQWADWNIQYRVDSEMLTQYSADKIRRMNQFYMDWHRVFADEKSGIDGAVKGSTRTIQNPLISLLMATEKTVAVGDQNFLMKILTDPLRLAQKVDNGIAMSELGRMVSEPDAEEAYKHHDGLVEHSGAPAKIYKMRRLVVEKQEDGRDIEKVITEHWVFDAATEASLEIARNEGSDHPWIQGMSAFSSLQRASIVLTPAFSLRTLTRDNLERVLVSEGSTSADGYKAWWEGELDGRNLEELHAISGASLAGMTGQSRDQIMREVMAEILVKDGSRWSTVSKAAQKYKHFQEWAEGVARKTEFAQAWVELKKQHPDWTTQDLALEAMSRSRNLLDTAKKGAFIGRMNVLTLFLNASIKGMVVNTWLLRRAIAAARAGKREEAAALSGVLALRVGTMAAASMLLRWMVLGMNDDDKQKKLMAEPGFMRDFAFRIDIPGMPKISIAKPYEMGWFTSGSERLADAMWAKGKGWDAEAARQVKELVNTKGLLNPMANTPGWLGGLKNTVLPMKPEDLGGSFLPLLEVMANKDFFRNQTIVSPYETGKDVKLREGTKRASGLGQGLQIMTANTVDARNIDHLIQAFFGGFGRMATAQDGTGLLRTATGTVGGADGVSGSRDVRWVLEKLTELGHGQGREVRSIQRLLKEAREAKTDEARTKKEQTILKVSAGLRKSIEANPKRWEKKKEE